MNDRDGNDAAMLTCNKQDLHQNTEWAINLEVPFARNSMRFTICDMEMAEMYYHGVVHLQRHSHSCQLLI